MIYNCRSLWGVQNSNESLSSLQNLSDFLYFMWMNIMKSIEQQIFQVISLNLFHFFNLSKNWKIPLVGFSKNSFLLSVLIETTIIFFVSQTCCQDFSLYFLKNSSSLYNHQNMILSFCQIRQQTQKKKFRKQSNNENQEITFLEAQEQWKGKLFTLERNLQ